MTGEQGLTCREVVELVTDYLEERLTGADRERFEEHLHLCPGCAVYLEQMRTVIRALGAVHPDDLDPAARADLMAAFRSWAGGRPGEPA